ncbi:hypothetical protein [Mesorhizobium sp. B2-3-4]|uniref:hypothetical protein n=1 Tax=Mesorhizobium sp. B2-3-4 TaxID=2589959 RepID=UPI0015E47C99|nr:hypothetical protein [Mesorhizobium sp. B2-3-4]
MSGVDMWVLVVAAGPLILLAAILYAMFTRRRKEPAEQRQSDRATRELYNEHNE